MPAKRPEAEHTVAEHFILLVACEFGPENIEGAKAVEEILDKTPGWCRYLQSTWLICTPETPLELTTHFTPHLTPADRLLIIKVDAPFNGWLPREAWDWMREYILREPAPRPARS